MDKQLKQFADETNKIFNRAVKKAITYNKYKNIRTEIDNLKFDSKKEAARYADLKLLKMGNEVLWFIRQPSFDIGGGVKYKADFLIVWADGKVTVEDVKGKKTDVYKIKKKLVEAAYPIKIEEV